MSRTMVVYFACVLVMWVPAALAVRSVLRGGVTEQLVGGLLVATVWPVSIPALSWTTLSGRRRQAAAQDAAVRPAPKRSRSCTTSGWRPVTSADKRPPIAPAPSTLTRRASPAN
jgi:hypothetical protein